MKLQTGTLSKLCRNRTLAPRKESITLLMNFFPLKNNSQSIRLSTPWPLKTFSRSFSPRGATKQEYFEKRKYYEHRNMERQFKTTKIFTKKTLPCLIFTKSFIQDYFSMQLYSIQANQSNPLDIFRHIWEQLNKPG